MEYVTPMDEIYAVRQKISASYNHDPHSYFKAMVERQKECVRQGRVYWGYDAAGELAPLTAEAMRKTMEQKLEMKDGYKTYASAAEGI